MGWWRDGYEDRWMTDVSLIERTSAAGCKYINESAHSTAVSQCCTLAIPSAIPVHATDLHSVE